MLSRKPNKSRIRVLSSPYIYRFMFFIQLRKYPMLLGIHHSYWWYMWKVDISAWPFNLPVTIQKEIPGVSLKFTVPHRPLTFIGQRHEKRKATQINVGIATVEPMSSSLTVRNKERLCFRNERKDGLELVYLLRMLSITFLTHNYIVQMWPSIRVFNSEKNEIIGCLFCCVWNDIARLLCRNGDAVWIEQRG